MTTRARHRPLRGFIIALVIIFVFFPGARHIALDAAKAVVDSLLVIIGIILGIALGATVLTGSVRR